MDDSFDGGSDGSEEEPMPTLTLMFESGPSEGTSFEISGPVNVGKASAGKKPKKTPLSYVSLPDPEVSSSHASLSLKHTVSRGVVKSTCLAVKDLGR